MITAGRYFRAEKALGFWRRRGHLPTAGAPDGIDSQQFAG